MYIRNTPRTIISNSSNPPPAREFAGPPVWSIHHPMPVRIAPGIKKAAAIIFLIRSGIKSTPGKISKNHASPSHRKKSIIVNPNKLKLIILACKIHALVPMCRELQDHSRMKQVVRMGRNGRRRFARLGRAMVDLLPDKSMIANKFILDFWLKLNDQFCHKSSVQTE